MKTRSLFEGVGVALVTPFQDGAVDRAALGRLARHLVDAGVHALYPCGCTGEATSLTPERARAPPRRARRSISPGRRSGWAWTR
jgi:dihydrodipicolinate synthase/N-acetylneuraminate lyase